MNKYLKPVTAAQNLMGTHFEYPCDRPNQLRLRGICSEPQRGAPVSVACLDKEHAQ